MTTFNLENENMDKVFAHIIFNSDRIMSFLRSSSMSALNEEEKRIAIDFLADYLKTSYSLKKLK